MNYNVYFVDSTEEEVLVGECKTEEGVYLIVDEFLKEHNRESNYRRAWREKENGLCVTFGSVTERFYVRSK